MNEYVVLTVMADDRPGLVDLLSRTIAAHEASWLESRMSRLAGKFAGILRIEVTTEKCDALEAALHGLREDGLSLQLERTPDPAAVEELRELIIDVVGHDRPGILAAVSHTLALQNVNVESLETERRNAPMSGESHFHAKARVRIPSSVDQEDLQRALEAIAGDLMVDLRIARARTTG